MNTEGGRINYVGLEKKTKQQHDFVSLIVVNKKKTDVECKMKRDVTERK